jgi:hypothetical protein
MGLQPDIVRPINLKRLPARAGLVKAKWGDFSAPRSPALPREGGGITSGRWIELADSG